MSKKRSKVHPKYKTRYRVRNWAEYDRALVRRGDLTIWFDEAAISAWELGPQGIRGRPRVYSALAFETALGRVGRRRWKKMAGCHQQARAENTFSRFKRIFGPRLRARDEEAQTMEASVACDVLDRMSSLGMPDSVAVLAP